MSMPRQKKVEKLTYTSDSKQQTDVQIKMTQDDSRVHLELLENGKKYSKGFKKDIFQPIFQAEIKMPNNGLPIQTAKQSLPLPPPPKQMATVSQPIPEPPQYVRDMGKFTFLGFLKKDNHKTIFLSSDKEIFLVHKGDKISGRYQVANITDEALTIMVLADGGEIVIPLIENKPLTPSRP
jgi:hypothetical protein